MKLKLTITYIICFVTLFSNAQEFVVGLMNPNYRSLNNWDSTDNVLINYHYVKKGEVNDSLFKLDTIVRLEINMGKYDETKTSYTYERDIIENKHYTYKQLADDISKIEHVHTIIFSNVDANILGKILSNLEKRKKVLKCRNLYIIIARGSNGIITDDIDIAKNVELLHIRSSGGIDKLPESISKMQNLTDMHVSGLKENALPNAILEMPSLKKVRLYFDSCQFSPNFLNSTIEEMYLHGYINDNIDFVSQFKSIKRLALYGLTALKGTNTFNGIKSLNHLEKLHILNIGDVNALMNALSENKKLKELVITIADQETITQFNSLNNYPELQRIKMITNTLDYELPDELFQNMPILNALYINTNPSYTSDDYGYSTQSWTKLPSSLSMCKNLKTVSIDDLRDVESLEPLRNLNIENLLLNKSLLTNLKQIFDDINTLKSLRILCIGINMGVYDAENIINIIDIKGLEALCIGAFGEYNTYEQQTIVSIIKDHVMQTKKEDLIYHINFGFQYPIFLDDNFQPVIIQ